MDWAGWALFGLVATAALTAVMISAQLAGLTRLDLPLVLGTVVTEGQLRLAPGVAVEIDQPRTEGAASPRT